MMGRESEGRNMSSKLPAALRKKLTKEAKKWEDTIADESPQRTKELMDEAELFDTKKGDTIPISPAPRNKLRTVGDNEG